MPLGGFIQVRNVLADLYPAMIGSHNGFEVSLCNHEAERNDSKGNRVPCAQASQRQSPRHEQKI